MNRPRPKRPSSSVRRRRGRKRTSVDPFPWFRIVVGSLLVFVAFRGAYALLEDQPPPRLVQGGSLKFPYIEVASIRRSEGGAGLGQLALDVSVRPGFWNGDCNPVEVKLDWQRPTSGFDPITVVLNSKLGGGAGPIRDFRPGQGLTVGPLSPGGINLRDLTQGPQQILYRVIRERRPSGLSGLFRGPLLTFKADWGYKRGAGRCYVTLPVIAFGRTSEAALALQQVPEEDVPFVVELRDGGPGVTMRSRA